MRRRVIHACLTAVLVALLAAPAASAATLSVDDDRQDCTAAGYTSIQDAIDAAAPGDTIAICPGTYVEGNGAANSNALTVPKSLTLKGAGADLVTISPRRYDGNDGVIAEDPQSIRYPRGNIITAVGTPAIPVTVDISGVSVDGNGVAAKAGVVFLDAQGSLRRSRVTDIVTSESPNASGLPGGYRSNFLGYGVAQVTSAQMAPAGAGPRTLTIANTRIDEYNRVGLLLDAGTNSASPVTRSGLDLRGVVSASQIVGRTLCWDAHVHGDCGDPTPAGNPQPQPLTTGPLFGQDGIRIVAGARGTVTGSIITQNLVQGENAPVRNSATNNQNLSMAAGLRFVDADAANSTVTRNNIVDNAYGIYNAGADGTSFPGGMVSAERNWWGLWSPVGGNPPQPAPLNDGPEVSPTTNPPYPENPVNGTPATATGSSTVDFQPYRSGPQSDPNTGQFPVVPAPIPVDDGAPAVTVSADRAQYRRGETVLLTAVPSDDFGIRRVTFFAGAINVGSDTSPPYTTAFTIPADAACGTSPVTAVAEDSLGQTATGSSSRTVVCDGGGNNGGNGGNGGGNNGGSGGGSLEAPTVKIPDDIRVIRREGATVTVEPVAKQGVERVEFFLGTRRVCRDTGAPYACTIKPYSSEIGSQTLRVVVTDRAGLTGQDSQQVQVPRFAPRRLQLEVARRALPGGRWQRTVTATVLPPKGVKRAEACEGGRVATVVRRGGATILDREAELDERCRVVVMRLTTRRPNSRNLRYKATVRFGGSTVLAAARKTRRFR